MLTKFYQNDFLKVKASPQKDWELNSSQTSKIKKSWQNIFQKTDDDLPIEENNLKRLLQYQRLNAISKAIIDADIELSICKCEKPTTWNDISGKYEEIKTSIIINDKTFIGSQKKQDEHQWYFLFKKFSNEYWFYIKIAIHQSELLDETLNVFSQIEF